MYDSTSLSSILPTNILNTLLSGALDVLYTNIASSANNKDLCFFKDDFLIEEMFSPPLIIGQVIVALTVKSEW